jgi:hypothetical protein
MLRERPESLELRGPEEPTAPPERWAPGFLNQAPAGRGAAPDAAQASARAQAQTAPARLAQARLAQAHFPHCLAAVRDGHRAGGR